MVDLVHLHGQDSRRWRGEANMRRHYRRPLLCTEGGPLFAQPQTNGSRKWLGGGGATAAAGVVLEGARGGWGDTAVAQRGRALLVGGVATAAKVATILFTRIFCAKAWPFLQTLSLSTCLINRRSPEGQKTKAAEIFVKPLGGLVGPILWVTVCQYLLQWSWPDAYRTIRFWRRLLPIYAGYLKTKLQVRKKCYEEREKAWAIRHEWGGVKVYELIADMSGFYVKSAQILASKAEFVPRAWTKHLSKLLDSAPPRPFSEVEHSISEQLGKCPWGSISHAKSHLIPLDAVFMEVERVPLAAASIAQVHGGLLKHGERVVIKVQHKGMEILMQSDLRNLAWLARFLRGQLPVDLFSIVKEIQSTIPLEFNFEREVWFMNTIRSNLDASEFKQIVCPLPHTEFCSKRLIVMQRIEGTPFTHILHAIDENSQARLAEAVEATKHLIRAYGQMILVDGVFHADPHAGNLFLLPDGRLGLLDYGQSKQIDKTLRKKLAQMTLALCKGDDLSIVLALVDMGVVFEPENGADVPVSTVSVAARILFDVCYVEEATVSPMSQNSILQTIPLKQFNQAVWMIVRTNLLLRGLCYSLKVDISAAKIWHPYALTALQEP